MPPPKPGYSLSRRAFWGSFVLSWLVIIGLAAGAIAGIEQAVAFAGIAVPSLVVLIAAMLGIHRAFGTMDFRTQYRGHPEEDAR